ncbi:MAG: glycosyltransferase family 4 protein [Gemmataceae bacterium]
MNVCLVSQEYPPETPGGGIGSQTRTKAVALARLGHDVHVLTCSRTKEAPDLRTGRFDGVTVHRMRPPCADFAVYGHHTYKLGYTWQVFRHLSRLAQEWKFDVVDFPEYGGEGFAYQLDRSTWNWLPVAVQLHGPTEMFVEYMGWPERGSRYHQYVTFAEHFSIRQADALMACSAAIAGLVSRYTGVPRDAIEVVHCGVDAERFRPGGRRAERPTVLFVGNVVENKGAHVVFDAVARLRTKYPDIHAIFLGAFPEGYELGKYFRTRLAADGLDRNIEFPGFVDADRLPNYYQAAHVFCSPAEFEGGVANVYLEAMACGCPVVASTAGGGPEAVTDGETGYLVPPNDVTATADALDRVLGEPTRRDCFGAAGRHRVNEYFAVEQYIRRVLAVYERAIARSAAHPDRHRDMRE